MSKIFKIKVKNSISNGTHGIQNISKLELFNGDKVVEIRPLTNKGFFGCFIQIPKENIDEFINILNKIKDE